jgi:hypothetical protein
MTARNGYREGIPMLVRRSLTGLSVVVIAIAVALGCYAQIW